MKPKDNFEVFVKGADTTFNIAMKYNIPSLDPTERLARVEAKLLVVEARLRVVERAVMQTRRDIAELKARL